MISPKILQICGVTTSVLLNDNCVIGAAFSMCLNHDMMIGVVMVDAELLRSYWIK